MDRPRQEHPKAAAAEPEGAAAGPYPIEGAYYQRDGDLYVPTAWCRGPWSYEHQHGGPPGALLAGLLQHWQEGRERWTLARVSFELYRPLPLAAARAEVQAVRLGQKVQRLEATLSFGGQVLMLARGLRIRRADLQFEAVADAGEPPPPPPPERCPAFPFDIFPWEEGYHQSWEARSISGRWGREPVAVWSRLRGQVVAGEEPTGWQRVVAIADAESGLAPPLDPRRWWFLNPELWITLHREPEGPWVGLYSQSRVDTTGTGIAESRLFDLRGTVGRSAQSLVVEPAPARAAAP